MSARTRSLLWGCALFSMCGLCMEIAFTGVHAWWQGSFRGQVSLLMIPVYSFAFVAFGPLFRALERLGVRSALVRVPCLVVVIYAIEWSFGAGYAALGLWPWRYHHGWASDFSGGHITLWYLPAWVVVALLAEPAWRVVRAAAPTVDAAARGRRRA